MAKGNPQWKKGQSGNPGGRPKKTPEEWELVRECRRLAPEALAMVASLMRTGAAESTRLKASQMIIERAYGAPIQVIANTTPVELAAAIREQQLATGVVLPEDVGEV